MGNQHSQQSRQSKRRRFKTTSSISSNEYSPSPTTSNFRYEGGRKFHRGIATLLPTDEPEAIRNEKQQIAAKLMWQGNFSSPIGEHLKAGGLQILDLGCGPGTWIIDMAKTYPLCSFTGVDIAPLHPSTELPENVEFIQANLLDGLSIENSRFDFVVTHFLSLPIPQWKLIIKEAARVMKPGAWLEWMGHNPALRNQGENTKKLRQSVLAASKARGVDPWVITEFPRMLDNSGIFVNIRNGKQSAIYGSAGGKCGELCAEVSISAYQAMKKTTLEFTSLTPQEYDLLLNNVREEFEQYQTMIEIHRFCAQKIVIDSE
ncbi:8361_t:CDS:2 [Ambispora gerdemannii]|uniref:8361_t:CDS:1 n=1 Tax=Ambispora gerdemannii TaxID=144530 RepID=A0A9N9C1I9_9GLOM|nr:8361_t:CDS:2 [Ambispora gerdemannii]